MYTKPELLAERPNELWSWDLTKLLGPAKWTYFYLRLWVLACFDDDTAVPSLRSPDHDRPKQLITFPRNGRSRSRNR